MELCSPMTDMTCVYSVDLFVGALGKDSYIVVAINTAVFQEATF